MTSNEFFLPCSLLHRSPLFVSDLCKLPCRYFLSFSHYCSTAACVSGIFNAWCTNFFWLNEFIPVAEVWFLWYLCSTTANRILAVSSASTIQARLVFFFPILRQTSPRQFTGVWQGIAAGIGISNFLRAFLMMCLNSSSLGSMKKMPRNCLDFCAWPSTS